MKKTNPFYKTAAWLKCREIILIRDNYLCQPCLRNGTLTTANTVHHIKPIDERPDLALDEDNLESICPPCHNREHPEKGGGERKARRKRKVKFVKSKPNHEWI